VARKRKRSGADRERFWRELIERQQQSGQSIRAFCDEEGVSEPSFFSWRKRLRLANGQPQPRFVPVQLVPEGGGLRDFPPIEVVLNSGQCVRIPAGFDPRALDSVLSVLEGRPC